MIATNIVVDIMTIMLALGVNMKDYPVAVQYGEIKRMTVIVLVALCVLAVTALLTWRTGVDIIDRATGRRFGLSARIMGSDAEIVKDHVRHGIVSTAALVAVTILVQMFMPPLGSTTLPLQSIVNDYQIKSIQVTGDSRSSLTSNGKSLVVDDVRGQTWTAKWMPSSGNVYIEGTIQVNGGRARIVASDGTSPALKGTHFDL